MTQEDKELLLKDLCARLPYGVKVRISSEIDGYLHENTTALDIDNLHKYILNGGYYKYGLFYKIPGFQLLPYLRPMSSMTEEEEIEYDATFATIKLADGHYDSTMTYKSFDYLNKKHFDFRNLIEKGLALEAPEGMYNLNIY